MRSSLAVYLTLLVQSRHHLFMQLTLLSCDYPYILKQESDKNAITVAGLLLDALCTLHTWKWMSDSL